LQQYYVNENTQKNTKNIPVEHQGILLSFTFIIQKNGYKIATRLQERSWERAREIWIAWSYNETSFQNEKRRVPFKGKRER
jgi:hypothetical protein